MKTIRTLIGLVLLSSFVQSAWAQSTTGGRSGGSTASTGTGYLTSGKRPAETSAASMTIADEGASRAYMYVPSVPAIRAKNRAASPDGSDKVTPNTLTSPSSLTSHQTSGKKAIRKDNRHH